MKFIVTSGFGMIEAIRSGIPHTGIDLGTPLNTRLRSITNGVVERVVDYGNQNLGKGVFIRSEDGKIHIFGHLNKITVQEGEKIFAGETIGFSGNTGHSTGPHLHFAVKDQGSFIDPTPYIEDVDRLSGYISPFETRGVLTQLMTQNMQESAKNQALEMFFGFFEALGEVLIDISYSVALIGSGILIILKVGGFEKGYRWTGILLTAHVLIKFLLSGGKL